MRPVSIEDCPYRSPLPESRKRSDNACNRETKTFKEADMCASPVITKLETADSAMSEAEWEMRVDLAACYRLVAHYEMDDLFATHISARAPGILAKSRRRAWSRSISRAISYKTPSM
jgi:hypothetical protein